MADFQSIFRDLLELESPMDKYEWIIEYAGGGRGLPDAYKTDEYLIRGCTSPLWVAKIDGKFLCEADSFIVSGFAGMICDWFNQATKEEQEQFSLNSLSEIGLAPLLSMGRQNGISNLIERIKKL